MQARSVCYDMKLFSLFRQSFSAWQQDKAGQLAASTAYYTAFSLAPLLLIVIGIAGLFFDSAAVQDHVMGQIQSMVGSQGAQTVGSMLEAANSSQHSLPATIIGFVMLLLGAVGLLMALQDALNFIWKVRVKKTTNGIWIAVLKRIFSFGLLLSIAFLLIVSLAVSAAIAAFLQSASAQLEFLQVVLPAANFIVSFLVIFALFALLFKFLPDVLLTWKDVWMGAMITALLFTIGKSLLGWYLGQKDFVSAYGVAGSLILLLLWVNYSAQILFFGVEFTKVYAKQRHMTVKPKAYAEFIR